MRRFISRILYALDLRFDGINLRLFSESTSVLLEWLTPRRTLSQPVELMSRVSESSSYSSGMEPDSVDDRCDYSSVQESCSVHSRGLVHGQPLQNFHPMFEQCMEQDILIVLHDRLSDFSCSEAESLRLESPPSRFLVHRHKPLVVASDSSYRVTPGHISIYDSCQINIHQSCYESYTFWICKWHKLSVA